MNEKNDIDIISCATDTIAAGAIEAIHTYVGSQIPKNVEDTVPDSVIYWKIQQSRLRDLVIISF